MIFARLEPEQLELIAEVARRHEAIPAAWEENWNPRNEEVAGWRDRMLTGLRDESTWIEVVLEDTTLRAFHWIALLPHPSGQIANIISLWVDPACRRQGIARRLKEDGEAWARGKGAASVRTNVHVRNTGMLELNSAFGFQPSYLTLTKRLE